MIGKRALVACLLALLASRGGMAAPTQMEDDSVPTVVTDTTKARQCVIAYLVTDTVTNDTFVSREQVEPTPDESPAHGLLACPTKIPARVAARALEPCIARTGDVRSCVFGDMARGFETQPDVRMTAENTSRCASDLANFIGIACWKSGDRNICDVACGKTDQEARDLARGRCEVKQQKRCPITGAVEILPPQ